MDSKTTPNECRRFSVSAGCANKKIIIGRKSLNSMFVDKVYIKKLSLHTKGKPAQAQALKFKHLMFTLTYPKPSSELSNSTNAGVTAEPCRRMSWGVVMDTRHLTRVRGTVLPSAERTRLRLMRYCPLSSAGVAKTLSGPKPSMDMVILSVKSGRTGLHATTAMMTIQHQGHESDC